MFFAGFVVSCFTFLIRAMVADISDEVRLDIGKDRAALLYGLITATSKVGSTLVGRHHLHRSWRRSASIAKEGVVNTRHRRWTR